MVLGVWERKKMAECQPVHLWRTDAPRSETTNYKPTILHSCGNKFRYAELISSFRAGDPLEFRAHATRPISPWTYRSIAGPWRSMHACVCVGTVRFDLYTFRVQFSTRGEYYHGGAYEIQRSQRALKHRLNSGVLYRWRRPTVGL